MLKHLQSSEDWNQKSIGAKGFTLIELLVVIVILGILAAVVVFAVSGIQNRGQKSACLTEGRTVRTAQEAYYAQTSGYDITSGFTNLVPKYLSKTPVLVTNASTAQNLDLAWDGVTCTGTPSGGNTGQAKP